jgi:hypothetical protein
MSRSICLAAMLACACKPDPADPVPPTQRDAASPAIACPSGTLQRGAAPPDGYRVWCETEAGVSHGPFRAWYPSGKNKTEGAFDKGEAEGEWTSWYDNGKLRSRGRYEKGVAVGEWERLDRDGKPSATAFAEAVPEDSAPTRTLVGIPACDLYITRYGACIDHAPEAVRATLRQAFDQTLEAWMEAANGPARDALPQACAAAYDAAKATATSWGCEL